METAVSAIAAILTTRDKIIQSATPPTLCTTLHIATVLKIATSLLRSMGKAITAQSLL
jgi:hypothetical protein